MILNRSKLASIILAVVFEIILMIPFLYALKKEFYFYQAVIIGLLILPFVLIALLQNTRKTLLALLIISVSINPSIPLYRSYLLAYPVSIQLCLSDLLLLSCWIYIIVKKLHNSSEYSGITQKYSRVFLFFYILWIAFGVFTLFFAVDKIIAIPELAGMIRILLVYLAVPFFIVKRSDLRFIAILFIVSVLLQAILILLQYRYEELLIRIPGGSQELDIVAAGSLFRPAGTLGHSSHYAILSALVLPLTLVLMQYSKSLAEKFFFCLILVVLFVALIITASRAGLGMGITGFGTILFLSRKTNIGKKLFFQSIAVLIMIFTAGWFVAGERLVDRITYDYNSAYIRIPMTKTALEVIKHHPLGVGLNNYTLVAPNYDYYDIFSYFPFPVHNIYLLNFAELGLLGGACLIGLLTSIIFLSFKYAEKIEEKKNKVLFQAIGIGIICSWSIGLLGWSQRSSNIHLLYFAILAAVVTSYSVLINRHQAVLHE